MGNLIQKGADKLGYNSIKMQQNALDARRREELLDNAYEQSGGNTGKAFALTEAARRNEYPASANKNRSAIGAPSVEEAPLDPALVGAHRYIEGSVMSDSFMPGLSESESTLGKIGRLATAIPVGLSSAAYETSKLFPETKDKIARTLGSNWDTFRTTKGSTSPANYGNVIQMMRGAAMGARKKKKDPVMIASALRG